MDPDELAGLALDQLLEITVLLGRDMTRGLAAQGLTEAKAHTLFLLADAGPCTLRALAEALEVSPRTITTLADELSDAGLVTRERHPTDRRATLLTPTAAGAELAAGLVAGRLELAEALFADFAPRELAQLHAGLEATLDQLRPMLEEDA